MRVDAVTKRWIRNASDERAVANGCRFNEERGQHVIDFAETYLKLYEGDQAGEALIARDWQIEATMRLFSWERHSDRWGRWIRRFNKAGIWVPKKNKKSPTLAWWALYLLIADGEKGQKVFFGAKDGAQAREIAGKHAIEMALASPELMSECKINNTLMQITHLPTRSILKPLSSSDSKSQKAKEGLNGSILIDETHVVDQAFLDRISRAGISRSEPLIIQVSTAGNDPESYGKKERDYGAQIADCFNGEHDERYFFLEYAAPQDLSDDDLAEDPIKYGQLANPAWGHTVGEDEYVDDYQRSRVSISELANFKMYRLNVWQASENPWLNMSDWQACQRNYTADDLTGRECWGGLDLAKTRDTTALALLFPDGSDDDGNVILKQLVYFWLPEAMARKMRDKVRYLEWASDGHLILTPGNTTDYNFVRKTIIELSDKFNVQNIAYDDHYADQLIQRLIEEDGLPIEKEVKFPQTMSHFAGPTAAYERAVIDRRLLHNGNPLLTWQAGNTTVKEDNNANMRPVKAKHGDYRTIDGVVAGIMAMGLWIASEGTEPTGEVFAL